MNYTTQETINLIKEKLDKCRNRKEILKLLDDSICFVNLNCEPTKREIEMKQVRIELNNRDILEIIKENFMMREFLEKNHLIENGKQIRENKKTETAIQNLSR